MIGVGVNAPWFGAPTHGRPDGFNFSSVGGRYIVLIFLPKDDARTAAMVAHVMAGRTLFRDDRIAAFFVTSSEDRFRLATEAPGLRWFLDRDDLIARGYGAQTASGEESGQFLLIDPSLRVMAWSSQIGGDQAFFDLLRRLPEPDDHAATPLHAPVLVVPRIFDLDLCNRLIALYDRQGGEVSGVMRDIGGRTVGVVDDFKRRRDCLVQEEGLQEEIRQAISLRLIPQIAKAFQFKVSRLERYLVACYDASEGGYFKPHRDNTTKGTAHRRFACSINLNAEDFSGGDLRFPEFGSRTYRPPTGGAVVFSCSLLHEATPVTRGRRYAFLPFLHDEDAERVREAYLASLEPSHPAPTAAIGRNALASATS